MTTLEDPPVAETLLGALEIKPQSSQPSIPPSRFKGTSKSQARIRDWTHTRWAQSALRREFITTTLLWALAAIVWITALNTQQKRIQDFDSSPSLRDATKTWIKSQLAPNYDQLVLFLHSTLNILNEFTPAGTPFRPLLKGIVSGKLLDEADERFQRDSRTIARFGLRQSFRMQPVENSEITYDQSSSRVSVIIHGTFELFKDSDPHAKPITIPYTGKVILSPNIPSQLNPYLFFLESIERVDMGDRKQ